MNTENRFCLSRAFAVRNQLLMLFLSIGVTRATAVDQVAFSTKVSNGYVRTKLADGSCKPETYAFGKGDDWSGARVDATIDKMDFMDVARVISVPLATQNYIPTREQKSCDLLIMVYWGASRAPEFSTHSNSILMAQGAEREQDRAQIALSHALKSPNPGDIPVAKIEQASANADMRAALEGLQAENQRREDNDMKTVSLLGYDSWWLSSAYASGGGERAFRKKDMLDEVEQDRYFVVLMAYDFKAMVKKKSKLLWEAHISIREHSNQFDKRLASMVSEAAPFFGFSSNGLHHNDLPEGKVDIGPVKNLGAVNNN